MHFHYRRPHHAETREFLLSGAGLLGTSARPGGGWMRMKTLPRWKDPDLKELPCTTRWNVSTAHGKKLHQLYIVHLQRLDALFRAQSAEVGRQFAHLMGEIGKRFVSLVKLQGQHQPAAQAREPVWEQYEIKSGLQIRCSKFQSLNSNSRELELTNLLGLVLGYIEAKFCK